MHSPYTHTTHTYIHACMQVQYYIIIIAIINTSSLLCRYCPYRRLGPPRVCVAAHAAENLVVQPAFSSSSRKLYYYTVYRGKEKTVAAAAAENTIPPGVRKSMVGRRRFGSPAVADARTPPPRTGDPFDRNSTHTLARTFVPTGRCIVADAATAEFPTPLLLGNIALSYTIFPFPDEFPSAFSAVPCIIVVGFLPVEASPISNLLLACS